jgi:hypothetical protein
VAWIDHFEPFQRSASIRAVDAFEYSPTATQSLADTHDTPESEGPMAPEGVGLD